MPSQAPSGRSHLETEIKLRVSDPSVLLDTLRRLGTRPCGRVLERNTLFDTPDADLRRRGRLLRLRVETPAPSPPTPGGRRRCWLTSKTPAPGSTRSRYKMRLERELGVDPGRNWLAALRSLGFRPGFRYEKFRTSFRLRRWHLDLDETPVGTFLEIEGSPGAIDRIACALGFSEHAYIRGTYGDLYVAQCRRRGQIPRNMLFHV